MISKKIKQTIAWALLIGVMVGASPKKVYADTINNNGAQHVTEKASEIYNNGVYELTNETRYSEPNNPTGENMARSAIGTTTKIEAKDGKYKYTFSFSNTLFQFMKNISVTYDGKKVEVSIDEAAKTGTFTIDSIDAEVKVDMYITAMSRNVSFYVKNEMNTLSVINEAPVITAKGTTVKVGDKLDLMSLVSATDREGENIDIKVISDTTAFLNAGKAAMAGNFNVTYKATDINGLSSTKTASVIIEEVKSEVLANGSYKIKNKTEYVGSGNADTGNQMARKTLKETSYLEVKDGKNALTLKFNEEQFAFVGNVKVLVDGITAAIQLNRDVAEATFEVPTLDSEITVTVEVTLMGRETTFKAILLKDTLEKVTLESDNGSDEGTETGDGNGSSSGNDSNSGAGFTSGSGTEETVKDEVVIVRGKLYSIDNEVHYKDNNPTGLAMARQYLDSTSTIEEIEGVQYINLTFSGMNYMSNHRFYVNGDEVSYRKTYDDGSKATFRFAIPDLGSTIKVKMYVAPMGRDVEFDVTLKEDTLTFIKEYNIEVLPQTGSPVDSNLLLMLGSVFAGSGIYLKKRNR